MFTGAHTIAQDLRRCDVEPPQRAPAVGSQLVGLSEMVNGLKSTIDALEARLQPVSRAGQPAQAQNGNGGKPSTGCPLSDRISELRHEVGTQAERLTVILDLLEI